MDGAKLVQRERLIRTLLLLPGQVERLAAPPPPVAPALGEGPKRAQGLRQPRLGLDPGGTGRASPPAHTLHAPPQQLDRPAEAADGRVSPPQLIGCLPLQGALAERG